MIPPFGVHVSAAAPLEKCVVRAADAGAEAFQIHLTAPQTWGHPSQPEARKTALLAAVSRSGIPGFIHAPYLINLAAERHAHFRASVERLRADVSFASECGVSAVVVHTGSHTGRGFGAVMPQVVEGLNEALDGARVLLLLENSSGQGGCVGSLRELAALLEAVGNPALGVCVDTCHAFAEGAELRDMISAKDWVDSIGQTVGLASVKLLHANDSKHERGSRRDRHALPGEGHIGREGFINLMRDGRLSGVPWVAELDPPYELAIRAFRSFSAEAEGN